MSNDVPTAMPRHPHPLRRGLAALLCASALFATSAKAGAEDLSGQSLQLFGWPIAISVGIPELLVMGGGDLVVKGVEASGDGIGWVVENSVDGSRAVLRFSGRTIGASAVAAGTVITVAAVSTGWVLSEAGKAIAFVPNEVGQALLHDEKVSR